MNALEWHTIFLASYLYCMSKKKYIIKSFDFKNNEEKKKQ